MYGRLTQGNRVLIFAPTFKSGSQKCNYLALANNMGLQSSLMAKADHQNANHPELKHGVKKQDPIALPIDCGLSIGTVTK